MNEQHTHGGRRAGSGRPPSPDTQPLIGKTLRMTAEEWLKVSKLAEANGVSVNEMIRLIVRMQNV